MFKRVSARGHSPHKVHILHIHCPADEFNMAMDKYLSGNRAVKGILPMFVGVGFIQEGVAVVLVPPISVEKGLPQI